MNGNTNTKGSMYKIDDKDNAGQKGVPNAEYMPCHIEPNGFCSNSIKPEKCSNLEQLHSGQLSP